MIWLRTLRRDERGASTAEFALVVPLFIALVLGVIYLSLGMYAAAQLHDATQWTARCLAVSANNPASAISSTKCPTPANVQTYAMSRYRGALSPTFTRITTNTCTNGAQVQGTGNLRLPLVLVNITVPITARACFPYSPASS